VSQSPTALHMRRTCRFFPSAITRSIARAPAGYTRAGEENSPSPRSTPSSSQRVCTAEGSRWAVGKDLSFTPLRPERVVEVRYEHMEGIRFRHTAQFNRWRPDRDPKSCTYEQLEEPVKYDLADILSSKQL